MDLGGLKGSQSGTAGTHMLKVGEGGGRNRRLLWGQGAPGVSDLPQMVLEGALGTRQTSQK